MHIPGYKYPLEQCSVPLNRRKALEAYRTFRRDCLERLQGEAHASVLNQVLELTWYTAVFRTLNESRRLEAERGVNGVMWELLVAGYANIITLGVRRLVDTHPNADSVWSVVGRIERRPELLTREFFVCHDGLPFDNEAVFEEHLKTYKAESEPIWLDSHGPKAFATAERMHEVFDALCGYPDARKALDRIDSAIFTRLRAQLDAPVIKKVCTMVDKTVAHAERLAPGAPAVPIATFNDLDQALGIIVRVCQFVSWNLLGEGGFGSIVATPQFDVLKDLDQPWCLPKTLPFLQEHWEAISRSMDDWVATTEQELLPPKKSDSSAA